MTYELVLGLEIHMQLNTAMKMFCSCKNDPFGSPPNTHVCPVCLGLPGALPVPNKDAIEKAQLMAHALGSHLRNEVIFERKNYFYPDLPKAYQLTTPHYPIAEGGEYELLFAPRRVKRGMTVKWREIHIEEDTAKSMHKEGKTWIDFNKSGVPLLEMVTEPDFHTVSEAVDFAKEVQIVARYVGASEADMEKGNMRLEANISLRKPGEKSLPSYRVELKNINSFTFMKNALEAEIKRQTTALDNGEKLMQETRGYNEDTKETFSQRGKEDAHDYRYFPEPDIPPIRLNMGNMNISVKLPKEYVSQLREAGVRESYIPVIVSDKNIADFTMQAISLAQKDMEADMVAGEIVNKKIDISKITPEKLIASLKESKSGTVSDEAALQQWVDQAVLENPKAVEDIKNGKMAAIGSLIGAVMKYSQGKADAKKVSSLLIKNLKG